MNRSLNSFKVVGVSHHLASVELREQFALSSSENITQIHHHLATNARGGFVLSTCNRTEIYVITDEIDALLNQWAALVNTDVDLLKNYLYIHEGKDAIEYLFRVGTGLDSQILGDFQIIGQIKQGYQQAVKDGASNSKLTRMIDMLLRTSKRVKNETELSSGVASMAYSAIQHVGKLTNEDWNNQQAFVYGAGKMGSAVVRKLAEIMPTEQVQIANRTVAKAENLANQYKVKNVAGQTLAQNVAKSHFLISTAAVSQPLFTPESLAGVDLTNKILVDLSMPRSISPELEKAGAKVINLDFLQDIQNETFQTRKNSIPKAEKIVNEELTEYFAWIKQCDLNPTMRALKEKLHIIKDVEVKRLRKDNNNIDEEQINRIADALINKVTTQCVKHVKRNNGNSLNLIHQIFELKNID